MRALQMCLRDYLTSRRAFGVKLIGAERRLRRFVEFMDRRGATQVTYSLALQWSMQPPAGRPTWAIRFTDVRGFSRYLHARDARHQILPLRVLAFPSRAKPYIYSDAEIHSLLEAALALPPLTGLRRFTYHALFGLLASTGMRIGEILALKRSDVDVEQGLLTVRGTKFGKTRIVPLHHSTASVLKRYASTRDTHLRTIRSDSFFVAERGGRLLHPYVWRVFIRLSRQIGLRAASARRGPRIHDFRHRFAVQTLVGWYRAGDSVEQLLPALSTYLGHVCVRDTYWYLSACPELMGHAVRRLERHMRATP